MVGQPAPNRSVSGIGRWLLVAALVLGGVGYVFRHSLFPADHAAEPLGQATTEQPMAVTVVAAEPHVISRRIVAGGTLVARDEVLITPRLQGVAVESYLADVGDWVTIGQRLAVLDSQRLEILLAQNAADQARAEAVIAQADALLVEIEAEANEAALALQRANELHARGAASEQALEGRKTAASVAQARADAQRQALLAAEADLLHATSERDELLWQREGATVRATAAGIVSERNAKVGQTTSGDGTPLFRILRDGEIEMEALFIETALPAISVGQAVTVEIAGLDAPVQGEVRLVSASADPATRMGKVWISLPGDSMRPGSFASAELEANRHEAIVVPRSAVLSGDAGSRVQVVQDNVVVLRQVETGLSTASDVEIIAGLEQGEMVVATAGGFLREGSRVSPVVVPSVGVKEGF